MDCSALPADHRRMGLYSHLTTEQLTARRDSYLAAIDAPSTTPMQASHSTDGMGARCNSSMPAIKKPAKSRA